MLKPVTIMDEWVVDGQDPDDGEVEFIWGSTKLMSNIVTHPQIRSIIEQPTNSRS